MPPIALTFDAPHTVGFVEEDEHPLTAQQVRLRTLFSGISAGTELTAYRGTNPYLHKRWDPVLRLFLDDPNQTSQRYPVVGWGYEEVGEVVEAGADVSDISSGTLVYGAWGHRSGTIMEAADARERVLPDSVDPVLGVFSQIGSIALNGVLDAAIRPGETVAVFGLGVVGQLVAQLARLQGAHVVAVDRLRSRLEVARRAGIDRVIDAAGARAGEVIKRQTDGRGADVCIEASGSTAALNEAIRACVYSSRVVTLGFFQGEARALYLGEEFHHNRITIICSQISGVAPDLQYRWSRLRLAQSFMRFLGEGRVEAAPLISHVTPVRQAGELFALLDEHPGEVLQAVLDFRQEAP